MSRYSKVSSIVVAGSVFAVLAALVPGSALAKGGSGPSMGGFSRASSMPTSNFGVTKSFGNYQVSKNIGNFPISKNVGNFPIAKKFDGSPIGKFDKLPIDKKLGKLPINKIDPISKIGKFPLCNPIDPCFCHHHHCCNPCWNWPFPWLFPVVVEDVEVVGVETVIADPLYTLYYETADGIKVYGRYSMPRDNELLYKTEQAFDKLNTAWWLVSSAGELVDTNTAEKVAAVKTTAQSE